MGPWPYSENSSIPNDSSANEPLTTMQILVDSPSPSTLSNATSPSPTPQETIPVELHMDTIDLQEDVRFESLSPCYPTPGDIMPYDHSLPDFIRQVTNQPNLAILQSLSLRVISACISLHRMAAYLPNLKVLDLEGSILNSLRDIGCSFKNLQILKVGRCQLESLDGTFGLSTLRELYAQKNLINDVSPCSNLPHIKHIDVSGNRIRNISYAGFLSVCTKLKSIVFTGNPATEVENYRKYVRKILPQIDTLDGVPFGNDDNEEEMTEEAIIDNVDRESSCSAEYPDFFSISPSDSLNNLLEYEEDVNLVDKKCKHAKNVANHSNTDHGLFSDQDVPDFKKLHIEDFKNSCIHAHKKICENPEKCNNTKTAEYNIKITQKCTQKLDKDNENISKQSNLILNLDYNDEFPPTCAGLSKASTSILLDETNTASNIKSLVREVHANEYKYECETSNKFTSENVSAESAICDSETGAIKNKTSSSPNATSQVSNKLSLGLGISTLTSGLPVRGNLTVALRSRNKAQNGRVKLMEGNGDGCERN